MKINPILTFNFAHRCWTALLCTGVLLAALPGTTTAADRYVNPSHAAAQDAGHGALNMPYRTLAFAMSQLQPGDHLVISEGVYREPLIFPYRASWDASTRTVIEGKGKVLIKGSAVVAGWTALGNGRYVKPWPKETAQVFIDGVSLQQIGGNLFGAAAQAWVWPGRKEGNQDSMPVGSFYYDKVTGNLFIRVDLPTLDDRVVEVSDRMFSMFGERLSNVIVRNLDFQHGNTSPFNRSGLVTMIGDKIWLDRINMSQADGVGIELMGNDNKISDSRANDCGQLGMKARGKRVQVARNETSRNNTRGFNKWWEAGGIKFVGLGGVQDSLITGHTAIGNFGDGIWFDWGNKSNRVEKSISAYNTGFGIQYEASYGGVITNNVVVANGQRGIYLPHSSYSVVAFNLVAGHKLQGIVVIDEGVRDPKGILNLKPYNNKVFGNVIAWNKNALVLPADMVTNRSDGNLTIGAPADTRFASGWQGRQESLSEWTARTGQDRSSLYVNNAVDAGAPGVTGQKNAASYIDWFKTFRLATTPLQIDPEWLKLIPGAPHDQYPGPML